MPPPVLDLEEASKAEGDMRKEDSHNKDRKEEEEIMERNIDYIAKKADLSPKQTASLKRPI